MKDNVAEESLSLFDAATSQYPLIAPEREAQKEVAADMSRPLAERLEAFEDIIDSEVGEGNSCQVIDTWLFSQVGKHESLTRGTSYYLL